MHWIGGIRKNNTWSWTDGSKINTVFSLSTDRGDCLYTAKSEDGRWASASCNEWTRVKYICKLPLVGKLLNPY